MRRSAHMKRSGPYRVESCSDGTLTVYPRWPQFRTWTEEDGGGPGLFSRMGLAHDLERWLNAVYDEATLESVNEERERIRTLAKAEQG